MILTFFSNKSAERPLRELRRFKDSATQKKVYTKNYTRNTRKYRKYEARSKKVYEDGSFKLYNFVFFE